MAVSSAPAAQTVAREGGFWHSRPIRKMRRNPLAITGFSLVVLFILTAILAPLIATPRENCLRDLNLTSSSAVRNPAQGAFWQAILAPPASCYQIPRISFDDTPNPPGERAVFGTSRGYDIFYGLVWGARTALRFAVIIVSINLLIGITIGAISGFYGGWIDTIIQRFIDVIFSIPPLIMTIVLITVLRPSVPTLILALTITGWAGYARIVRGDILRTRELEYVDAARSLGALDWRLIAKHVVPNSLTSIVAVAVLDLGTVPLSIAGLSFLGLGLPVGYSDWGQLMAFARTWIQGPAGQPFAYWYVTFFPAITIILFSLGWNLLGSAARDAFDPRSK
ncbi:ABC transporter permease [Deinococcus peraridilitoris]|uniref:ABC-type dipeptide/oligopeptide/nickel transport system, permease component n=1 Tax=Deinococcus peraridilitoris (strain DSM 19664 / LMG 22246 / CIP 109416 / KR-200) TaxID=937777 RepID=L0A0P7_DEIPD|nr:ABC transporter permease [Deinococcus peraridilitoris]AFZ66575.1 ABC-type dipeptide/oligopeptide/nickel transport system, permease component [Deinococcus peraridilitoris DSM 19664]